MDDLVKTLIDIATAPWRRKTQRKIETEFVYPPIPDRRFDWSATFEGYEPGELIGRGSTEQAAIADLLEQAEEDE